jgi:hypothetical protein
MNNQNVILTIKRNDGSTEKIIVESVEFAILTYRRERCRKTIGDRAYGAHYSIDNGKTTCAI